MQAIISNASCLILLHKIGELHLLQKLYGSIMTTPVVADEFGKPLPEWIHLQNPANNTYELLLKTAPDQGEASAVALALEHKRCLLIIDEQKGRKMALQLG
jgi:predicted nucleic acid-binding protein